MCIRDRTIDQFEIVRAKRFVRKNASKRHFAFAVVASRIRIAPLRVWNRYSSCGFREALRCLIRRSIYIIVSKGKGKRERDWFDCKRERKNNNSFGFLREKKSREKKRKKDDDDSTPERGRIWKTLQCYCLFVCLFFSNYLLIHLSYLHPY